MQDESNASSNRVASILRMYLPGSFALLVGHSRSEARLITGIADVIRLLPTVSTRGFMQLPKRAEAPKFERLPLCLWYCCMHYILPA
jgi:hypothetical protein